MKLDIIIPTMWKADNIPANIEQYCKSEHISKVIIIDNNKNLRPDADILKHPKVELVCYNKNIFVNPAWNEGYYRSTQDVICLLNDDISVDLSIFEKISNTDFENIDVIGVNLIGGKDNYTIGQFADNSDRIVKLNYDRSKPIGGQAWAFGICMFIKRSSYKVIPSLYQVWYGDDYLVQHNNNIYVLMTNKIKGVISKTIASCVMHDDISARVNLDSLNAYQYNHFQNGKNWDIFKKKITSMQTDQTIFETEYKKALITPSDINQNLPVLYELAKQCEHVTEMGVRTGVSTRAFLNTNAELISYDIVLNPEVENLFAHAKELGKKAQYIKADVLTIDIEPTDLLFIDTYHVYEQLTQELKLHANKVRKYIAFHDTYTFGLRGENANKLSSLIDRNGLITAIIEFLIENPDWKIHFHTNKNNGMTVLKRK